MSAPVTARPSEIWTRLTVDPLADPLAAWLARRPSVTPNRVTALAAGLAVSSATCFALGLLRTGGALFLARFFVDCLDGKVARAQGSSSRRGAALDVAVDVAGISLVVAALAWFLTENRLAPGYVGLALLAAMVFYNWALAYRKDLARQAGSGDGGTGGYWQTSLPVLRRWASWSRGLHMSPVPWAVEVEIAVLGLAPLLLPAHLLVAPLVAGLGFYLLAGAVNSRRIWALAGRLQDLDRATEGGHRRVS